ncbi:hypothetical protein [Mesoplasma photuris]|uniref:hypothetical protein n=1 Tax=Mesoplasma photuris TaxID=217731 RepID=UPI0004E1D563|nr:hypothetical protein [Mesoplasma photuris]
MYYLNNQSVLIEIKTIVEKNKHKYLIGDQIYASIPQSILEISEIGANWNRALKYFTIETNLEIIKTGYYMINFDIFLDFIKKDISLITKNFFFQKIINQSLFHESFMHNIFKFKNRNLKFEDDHNIGFNEIDEYNISVLSEKKNLQKIDRFLSSKKIDSRNIKYKDLFVISNDFKIEITDKNQRVYYVKLSNLKSKYPIIKKVKLIDLKKGIFYIDNVFNWKHEIKAELFFEYKKLATQITEAIIEEIKFNSPKSELNWHLYNLTENTKYIIEEIETIFSKDDFIDSFNLMLEMFKNLKLNYLKIILENSELSNYLMSFAKTETDIEMFKNIKIRYGQLMD